MAAKKPQITPTAGTGTAPADRELAWGEWSPWMPDDLGSVMRLRWSEDGRSAEAEVAEITGEESDAKRWSADNWDKLFSIMYRDRAWEHVEHVRRIATARNRVAGAGQLAAAIHAIDLPLKGVDGEDD